MTTRYFGERIKRNEDPRLLTGQGLYVDDVDLPNMLHAAFVRSPYAHARVKGIDVSQARQRAGVIAVYTADDLSDYWKPGPLLVSPPPVKDIVFNEKTQVPLARSGDKVKFAGEPVVMVLAQSRYIAEDALAELRLEKAGLPRDRGAADRPGKMPEEPGRNPRIIDNGTASGRDLLRIEAAHRPFAGPAPDVGGRAQLRPCLRGRSRARRSRPPE